MTGGPTLAGRCASVELLVVDVDGVLTDGRITYGDDGVEWKSFFVRDGSGLKIWHHCGKRSALITGRSSRTVEIRAAELGMAPVFQGAFDKVPAFRQVLAGTGMKPPQVCYVGDDLPDLPVMAACGLAVAVADACPEVRAAAHYVTRAPGGRGAVREAIELILQNQGLWADVLAHFRGEPASRDRAAGATHRPSTVGTPSAGQPEGR